MIRLFMSSAPKEIQRDKRDPSVQGTGVSPSDVEAECAALASRVDALEKADMGRQHELEHLRDTVRMLQGFIKDMDAAAAKERQVARGVSKSVAELATYSRQMGQDMDRLGAAMRDALSAQREEIQGLNDSVAADITTLSFAACITLRSDDALIPAVREFGRRRVADASPEMQEKIRAAYLELLGIEM